MRLAISPLAALLAVSLASVANAQGPISLDPPQTDPPVPRLRVGGEFGAGVAYGATSGAVIGGYGQLGAQITRELGLFYQPGLIGYGFNSEDTVETFVSSSHSAMVDLTFRNVAQVGIGGGLDYGKFSWCDEDTSLCTQDSAGVHPSLSLRAAFLVAFVRNNSRWGIPIALHAHTVLWDHRAQNHLMLTIGFSRY